MIVRFLTPARMEFLEAVEYYDSRTPGVGAEFLDDLERTVRVIGCRSTPAGEMSTVADRSA